MMRDRTLATILACVAIATAALGTERCVPRKPEVDRRRRARSGPGRRSRHASASTSRSRVPRTGAWRAAGWAGWSTRSPGGTKPSSCGQRVSPSATGSCTSPIPAPRASSCSTPRGTRNCASPAWVTRRSCRRSPWRLDRKVRCTWRTAGCVRCCSWTATANYCTISHDDLQRPSSVAFDAIRQRLYVGDSKAHVVHVFDEQGHKVASIGGLGAGPGQFNSPTHLALTPDGGIVVTDALNFRVEVFGAGRPVHVPARQDRRWRRQFRSAQGRRGRS